MLVNQEQNERLLFFVFFCINFDLRLGIPKSTFSRSSAGYSMVSRWKESEKNLTEPFAPFRVFVAAT